MSFFAVRQGPGFQWVKWSEIGWPRLVDIPPERRMTWFAQSAPKAPEAVVPRATVKSPSQGDGAADGGDEQEETVLGTALPEEGNHTMNNSSSRLADFVADTTGSAPASPAGVDAAPPAAEPDSAVEGAPEAPVAEDSAPLAESAGSENDAEPSLEVQEDPGYVGDVEETTESAPSVLEQDPPTQAEDRAPSPAEPADPKVDDAKSVSSASSESTVQPPSDVAKGKRKCVDFVPSEEEMPFNSSHQRSFPLVRNKSLSGLVTHLPERTKTPLPAIMVYEEGEPSRPSRSTLKAIGLLDSDWDDSVLAPGLQLTLPSEPIDILPEPVGDVPKPVVVLPEPVGDVTDHVHDLPTPVGTLPKPVGNPPTMSGALPVPSGWQPEPVGPPQPAEIPKVRWTSLLLRKLRNAALPRPVLQLLLGREVADQVKSALERLASGTP